MLLYNGTSKNVTYVAAVKINRLIRIALSYQLIKLKVKIAKKACWSENLNVSKFNRVRLFYTSASGMGTMESTMEIEINIHEINNENSAFNRKVCYCFIQTYSRQLSGGKVLI